MCLRFVLRYLHIFARRLLLFLSKDDNKSRKTRKIDDNPKILHWYDIAITVPIEILIISRVYLRACLVNFFPGKACGAFVVKFKITGSKKARGWVGKSFQRGTLTNQQLNWNGKTGSVWLTVESEESCLNTKSLVRVRCSEFLVASKVR